MLLMSFYFRGLLRGFMSALGSRVWGFVLWKQVSSAKLPFGRHPKMLKNPKALALHPAQLKYTGQHPRPGCNNK